MATYIYPIGLTIVYNGNHSTLSGILKGEGTIQANQTCKMLFRPPWRKIEDIGEYAETLGFEEESYLDLFQAVMELDKKYRVPVLLFYYERYSTAEIASILKIPEKTVSTRLFRAKAKLKNYLKEE